MHALMNIRLLLMIRLLLLQNGERQTKVGALMDLSKMLLSENKIFSVESVRFFPEFRSPFSFSVCQSLFPGVSASVCGSVPSDIIIIIFLQPLQRQSSRMSRN